MELRYRATLEYDGTDFQGFQIQARGRTIQGELEKAVERITGKQVCVLGAGRTDAGVHATGQVIAFDVSWQHSVRELQRALNAVLPEDMAISQLTTTYATFHPRFDAKWRQYRYTILNQPVRSPLWARHAHYVAEYLDVQAMEEASQALIGSHDFAAFGRPPRGENTVRHVLRVEWHVQHPGHTRGKLLVFEITANAFLYRMVRNIVGTLTRVGRGEFSPDKVIALLEVKDRAASGPPVPACGLCLVGVGYADSE